MKAPEKYRLRTGLLGTTEKAKNNGYFIIPFKGLELAVVCSDGIGWEHVSVSLSSRTPTWEEMCFIKDLFWDEEDCVVQYHPPKSDYVNIHPFCLHLWKNRIPGIEFPRPPKELVG